MTKIDKNGNTSQKKGDVLFMISKKEMQYVDSWSTKIPMPGYEYSKMVMMAIKDCYEKYNKLYKNKEYNLIFSNGEEISFEILSKNLCHMLGIDYKNIRDSYFEDYRKEILNIDSNDFTSYDLLESLIENMEKVIELDNDMSVRYKLINYYKSGIKCQIFNKLSNFDKFNFAAINYDAGDNKYDYKDQKIFFIPSNEKLCPYFMMGIKKSNDFDYEESNTEYDYESNTINKYIVSTLFAPTIEQVAEKFKNQEVIIPTQILISDNNILSKINATAEEKMQLLTMYKSIIETYKIPNKLNIYGDYESMIKDEIDKVKVLKINN